MKEFISVEDGIILKGQRIMILRNQRQDILNKLHISQQGIEKTQLRARICVYWRGIDKEIEILISDCIVCQTYSKKQQKENLLPHHIPSGSMQYVSTDVFEYDDIAYLLVTDAYSKMPFVHKLNRQTGLVVIDKMKTIFCDNGISEVTQTKVRVFQAESLKYSRNSWISNM